MIVEVIKTLNSGDYYGAGKNTEIAKGKYKYITSWKECFYKIYRIWRSKK